MGKKRKQPEPEKSEPQLNNEDLVIEKSKEVVKYQKELDCLLSAQKNAGAVAGHKETDSDDSDAAHDDDDDVEDGQPVVFRSFRRRGRTLRGRRRTR